MRMLLQHYSFSTVRRMWTRTCYLHITHDTLTSYKESNLFINRTVLDHVDKLDLNFNSETF